MKITEMNLDLAKKLMNWWIETGDARVDEAKDPDMLYNSFFDNGVTQFYTVPGALLMATNINPTAGAILYELGLLGESYDVVEVKNELISIVREYDLKRLTFACPSCVNAYSNILKPLGFKFEGRMKFAGTYNGKLCDIDLYGFYSVKPAKRRRRGRRNDKKDSKNSFPSTETGTSSIEDGKGSASEVREEVTV